MRGVVDGYRPVATVKGLTVSATLPEGPVVVGGDEKRLQQVFWNVLSNAVKFTPAGGHVAVHLTVENDEAVVRVEDSGVGIAAEFLPYVFDRFRQADGSTTRAHGGLGLGLALVSHFVELHRGTVEAHSSGPGAGAVFTVRLRLMSAEAAAAAARGPAGPEPRVPIKLAGLRVLVVDDEEDTRDLLVAALGHSGAEVEPAGSAREALSALRRRPPDVLVCDIAMPGEDGYALLARVRALAAEDGGLVPAVALTAYARVRRSPAPWPPGTRSTSPSPSIPASSIAVVARMAARHRSGSGGVSTPSSGASPAPLSIAFVTSEMTPFMKTGGLADVSAALPRALARLGHRVTVLPSAIPARSLSRPASSRGRCTCPSTPSPRSAGFYRRALEDGLEVVFIEHPPFFDRPNPYGPSSHEDYGDNHLRFAFLSRAALEYLRSRGQRPDVFHGHDWQAGLAARLPEEPSTGTTPPSTARRRCSRSTTSPTRETSGPRCSTSSACPGTSAAGTRSDIRAASAT